MAYSELNQNDVVPVSNLIKIEDREGSGVTGLAESFGRVVVTTKQSIQVIDTRTDPSDPTAWSITESLHNIGNIAKHGLVDAVGSIYVVHYDGIYALSPNNLANTDQTPTKSLRISDAIAGVFDAVSDKTAIHGEYMQETNEVVWRLDVETDAGTDVEYWAFDIDTGEWREISTSSDITIMAIDENADLMVYDDTTGRIKSFRESKWSSAESTQSTVRTKRFSFDLERVGIIRQVSVYYASDDDFTIKTYLNDSTTPEAVTYTCGNLSGESVRHIPIKRYCKNFQLEIVTEDSVNDFELNKIVIEVES